MSDVIVCRCQEVTDEEIRKAVAEGAVSIDGVKRRTRAGMGLCQGKTCQRLVARIIAEETGISPAELVPSTVRPPVRPVRIGLIAGDGNAK